MNTLNTLVFGTLAMVRGSLPIAVVLTLVCGAVIFKAKRPGSISRRDVFWNCLAPFITPLLIMIAGAALAHDHMRSSVNNTDASPVVFALLLLHIPYATVLVWRKPPLKSVIIASSVLAFYISACVGIISIQLITDDWM